MLSPEAGVKMREARTFKSGKCLALCLSRSTAKISQDTRADG